MRPSVVRIETTTSSGSGVIFKKSNQTAYILTNHHVVSDAGYVEVTVNDSRTYDKGLVHGTNEDRDLAVVSICCDFNFKAAEFGDVSVLNPGDEVIAMGYPLGIPGEATVTKGIVSALRYSSYCDCNVIQTDAPINPGNSGGPMFSLEGKLLGINTFGIEETPDGRPVDGVGFALSAVWAERMAEQLSQVAPDRDVFGPEHVFMTHDPDDGLILVEWADNIWRSDMYVSGIFSNPYDGIDEWSHGFLMRSTGEDDRRFLVFIIRNNGQWEVFSRGEDADRTSRQLGEGYLSGLDVQGGGENYLEARLQGDQGIFVVNGEVVATLDISSADPEGYVGVTSGLYTGDERRGAVTRVKDFTVAPIR